MAEGEVEGLMVTVGRKVDCQEPGIVVTLIGPEESVCENFSPALKQYVVGLLERTAQPDI